MDRQQLAHFLRRCRTRLHPADAGLPTGVRRRTPGLRREEVAQLSGMSTDYYTRLEQARGPQPSTQLLAALARGLRLSDDERDHLYHLVGHQPPPPHASGGHVRPALLRLLDRLDDTPALVMSDLGDILVQNAMAKALLGDFGAVPAGLPRNHYWRWFTDPAVRALHPPEEHDRLTLATVADLRAAAARRAGDRDVADLIGRLRAASGEFAVLWDRHDVRVRRADRKRFVHPVVGELDLDCETILTPDNDQRVLLFTARPGTTSQERLQLLQVVGLQDFAELDPLPGAAAAHAAEVHAAERARGASAPAGGASAAAEADDDA